jgi:autotransporter translocation and assembly factor TamB
VRLKVPGRLAWAAAALAALVGARPCVVHTPPVARWGRDWLVRQVAAQWQLDLATSRLGVNLFTRRVTLDDVRLAAPGHADEPFLTARRLEARLPWAVFGGTVRVSMLEVDDGRVWLVREGGAIVNLPPSSGQPPPAVARRFDLRGLRVRNLAVDYEDRTGDVDVSVTALTLSLDERDIRIFAGASGTIAAERLRVRMGAHETASAPLSGRLAFDGSNVSLQAFTVPLPEGRIVVDGRVNRVLDDLRFALTLAGTLDYEALAAWTPPPVPVSGAGAFEGTFEGPLGGYELRANFRAPGLRIGRANGLPLTGTVAVTPPRAHVETFTVTAPPTAASPREGVISGQFTYEFGRGASELVARFRDLDLDVALAAYDREPLTFAAWQRGEVTLRRASPQAPMALTASGHEHVPPARGTRGRGRHVAGDARSRALVRASRPPAARRRPGLRHDGVAGGRRPGAERALGAAHARHHGCRPGDPRGAAVRHQPLDVARRRDRSGARRSRDGRQHGADGDSRPRRLRRPRAPTGAPATALADIVYDGDTLDATHFELTTPGARVAGNVAMGMEAGGLAGAFTAEASDLPTLAAPWASLPGLTGTARMAGTIGGTTAVPDVPFTLQSTPLDLDGQRIGAVDLEGRLRGTVIQITRGAVEQTPGVLTATGTVDYLTGAYDLDIDGKALHWKKPAEGAPVSAVTMDVAFRGAGTFEAPGGSGTLTALPVGGSIGDFIGAADVRWQFAGGMLNATAFLPSLRTWAQATVEPRAPYAIRGVAAVNALDVQPFALAAGALTQAVTGTVGLSAAFDGRLEDPATLQAFVNLQDVALLVGGLPVTLDHPTRITARADDFSVDDLALTVGTSALRASGRFHDTADRPLRATYTGNISDVVALGRAVGVAPEVTATGGLNATWESRGSVANARSTIDVTTAWITLPGYPPVQDLEAAATFDGAVLSLDRLAAVWQGGNIAATARLPRPLLEAAMNGGAAPAGPPGRVDVTVKGLTHEALQPWLPPETLAQMDARVSATLGLDVTALALDGLRGTLVLDEASLTAAGVPITQARPARMSIAGGTLSFDDVAFSAGTPVVIGGTVAFRRETELNVTLTGTPGLRPFSVLSPAMAVDGAAVLDLKVTGTPQAPLVNGRIDLDDAEVVMRDPRVIASDITGPILFNGDRVTLGNLRGFLNGGDFEASGTARVLGVDVATGEFTFQARGVAVEYPENVDSEIDALLQFAPGATPTLKGDVRILRGAYRATISLPALVAFNATRTVPRVGARLLRSAAARSDGLDRRRHHHRQQLRPFRSRGQRAAAGHRRPPAVTGRAELREGGEVFMLGGLYRLNESTIAFSNPNAIEPDMNISMVTRSNGADQTLTLSGTLDKLQTSVVSSDPNADVSLAALFVGGDTTLDRNDALRLLSGELLGVTGRAIGLDSLRLERGFSGDEVRQDPGLVADLGQDPATRLTLSKQLSSDVEVVLSQGIGQGALSGYVTWRPLRGVELRATSLDNTDRLLSVRHDISFGGARVQAAPRRVMGKVAAVRFVGAPADDEAPLRGQLRLTDGDTFDFIRWRDDVERLQTWYRERGFLEVRVRASRADQPDGRVALTYTVARGPATELRVEGMEVPGRLRRQLETTWSDAVFDRFLLDEIQSALQFELVRQNVINAQVEAVVSATDPVKVITASVRGGETATRRRILYDGAVTLSPSQLDAEVAVWGLSDWGWLYPPSIANAITNRYDAEGRRAAKVTAADPVVVDGQALLTVTIEEGPLTTVTSATLAGAEPLADAGAVGRGRARGAAVPLRRGGCGRAAGGVAVPQCGLQQRAGGAGGDRAAREHVRRRAPRRHAWPPAAPGAGRGVGRRSHAPGRGRERPWTRQRRSGQLHAVGAGPQACVRHERVPAGGRASGGAARAECRRHGSRQRARDRQRMADVAAPLRSAARRSQPGGTGRRHLPGPPPRSRRGRQPAEPQRLRAGLHVRRLRAGGAPPALGQHLPDLPDAVRPGGADERVRGGVAPGRAPRRQRRVLPAARADAALARAAHPPRPVARDRLRVSPQARGPRRPRSRRSVLSRAAHRPLHRQRVRGPARRSVQRLTRLVRVAERRARHRVRVERRRHQGAEFVVPVSGAWSGAAGIGGACGRVVPEPAVVQRAFLPRRRGYGARLRRESDRTEDVHRVGARRQRAAHPEPGTARAALSLDSRGGVRGRWQRVRFELGAQRHQPRGGLRRGPPAAHAVLDLPRGPRHPGHGRGGAARQALVLRAGAHLLGGARGPAVRARAREKGAETPPGRRGHIPPRAGGVLPRCTAGESPAPPHVGRYPLREFSASCT